jgi:hypothetical protein
MEMHPPANRPASLQNLAMTTEAQPATQNTETEIEKLTKIVDENPLDFATWTAAGGAGAGGLLGLVSKDVRY